MRRPAQQPPHHKRVKGGRPNLADVLPQCRFRTLLGRGTTAAEMMSRCVCTIAILGGEPESLTADVIAEALACLQAGHTVLLIADRPDLRDYAKREILGIAGPATGAA